MYGMRKILTILLFVAVALCLCPAAVARTVSERRIVRTVNGFRGTSGFEIMKIGKAGLLLARSIAGMSDELDDPEARDALKLLKGIDRVILVDYEEASERERDLFNRRISSALPPDGLLLSVREEGSTVNVYGRYNERSGNVDDLAVCLLDESSLVCVFGKLSVEDVMKLAKMD